MPMKISNKGICIVPCSKENYDSSRYNLLKHLTKKMRGIYVTIETPYAKLSTDLKKNGINLKKLYFIDCISKKAGIGEKKDNCDFISGLESLTELSIAITDALNTARYDFLFFDSLSSFLKAIELNPAVRFMHYLIGKLLILEVNGIFMALDDKLTNKVINTLTPHIDRYAISPTGISCIELEIIH